MVPAEGQRPTKYCVFLCVILCAVQAKQRAVVEILDDIFKLVTERTPNLRDRNTSDTSLSLQNEPFVS